MTVRAKSRLSQERARNIIHAQQHVMIAEVEALRVCDKSEIIGAIFEESFRKFLENNLPSSLRVVPGFIVSRDLNVSSHFDALIVDTRYPFLASVGNHRYVMAASVVCAIELTTNLNAIKLKNVIRKSAEIDKFGQELYGSCNFGAILFYSVCVDTKLSAIKVRSELDLSKFPAAVVVLRFNRKQEGYICWLEGSKNGRAKAMISKTPLADLVYLHLQDGILCLSGRDVNHNDISNELNHYISWGTAKSKHKNSPHKV